MKKVMVFMVAFMLLGSVGAWAGENSSETIEAKKVEKKMIKLSDMSGTFSTSCGTWSFEITCPACTCNQLVSTLVRLMAAAEQACGTGEEEVSVPVG